jgi:hypothetical protein
MINAALTETTRIGATKRLFSLVCERAHFIKTKKVLVHQGMMIGAEAYDVIRMGRASVSGGNKMAELNKSVEATKETFGSVKPSELVRLFPIICQSFCTRISLSPFTSARSVAKDARCATSPKGRGPSSYVGTAPFTWFSSLGSLGCYFAFPSTVKVRLFKLVGSCSEQRSTKRTKDTWPTIRMSFWHGKAPTFGSEVSTNAAFVLVH